MKAQTLTNQKIWPMLKFLWTKKPAGQKLYAPNLSMREHKNDIFYHFQSNPPTTSTDPAKLAQSAQADQGQNLKPKLIFQPCQTIILTYVSVSFSQL